MTIDLGFAWLTLPSGQEVSIVDVPGHERFIKNMLAGVGGIDVALLVVAADEGVMPQTREHLAILDLLGVRTRRRRADQARPGGPGLAGPGRRRRSRRRCAARSLAGAPLIPVSAITGAGLDDLLATLDRLLDRGAGQAEHRLAAPADRPRLHHRRLRHGRHRHADARRASARAGGRDSAEPASAGASAACRATRRRPRRCPRARAWRSTSRGWRMDDLRRGDVLTTPGWLRPTRSVDVRLRLVAGRAESRWPTTRWSLSTRALSRRWRASACWTIRSYRRARAAGRSFGWTSRSPS